MHLTVKVLFCPELSSHPAQALNPQMMPGMVTPSAASGKINGHTPLYSLQTPVECTCRVRGGQSKVYSKQLLLVYTMPFTSIVLADVRR